MLFLLQVLDHLWLKNKEYEKKVRHIIIDENFPDLEDGWKTEEYQREKIYNELHDAEEEDFILYSDSDEIPDPKKLKKVTLLI